MGFVQEPPPGETIYLRWMSEYSLGGVRRKVWQRHRKTDMVSRKNASFGPRTDLAAWLSTPPSVPPPRPPLDPERLARLGGNAMLWTSADDDEPRPTELWNWQGLEFDSWQHLPSSPSEEEENSSFWTCLTPE